MDNYESVEQKIQAFEAEIEAVQKGILNWFRRNGEAQNLVANYCIQLYKKALASSKTEETLTLLQHVDDTIWLHIGIDWLPHRYNREASDVWDCAVFGAIEALMNDE